MITFYVLIAMGEILLLSIFFPGFLTERYALNSLSKQFQEFSLYFFNALQHIWSILINRGVRLQPYSTLQTKKGML